MAEAGGRFGDGCRPRSAMLCDQDILYIGFNPWDSIVQRPRHLAEGLSQDNRVLYVDPSAFSVLTRLKLHLSRAPSVRGWAPRLRQLSSSLFVFTPPPLLPFSLRSAAMNRMNARIVGLMLPRVFRQIRFRPRILWLSSPHHAPFLSRVTADLICYDCMDNVPAFYRDRRADLCRQQEQEILKRVHVAFATENTLADKCRTLCSRVHLIPNAAHRVFLEREERPCPADLTALPRPVMGFVGNLSEWVDTDLVRNLAEERPAWSFVMVGPIEGRGSPGHAPNIHLLGPRRHHDLPAYIDQFDVCMIPFRDNELTQAVNPVKLYEYLARGKPVVATATRPMNAFASVCYLSGSRVEFLHLLEKALEETGGEKERLKEERIRVARENTWEHRTEEVRVILGELLPR